MYKSNNHLKIKRKIKKIISEHGATKKDCGSMHIQIMCINERIRNLKCHIENNNKNDIHNRRVLVTAFQHRTQMIKYLKNRKPNLYLKYTELIKF